VAWDARSTWLILPFLFVFRDYFLTELILL